MEEQHQHPLSPPSHTKPKALIRFVLELGQKTGSGSYASRGALPFYAAVVCEYLAGLKQVGVQAVKGVTSSQSECDCRVHGVQSCVSPWPGPQVP